MLSFDEALAQVIALARPLGRERVALARTAGRILAAPAVSRSEAPAAPTSSMDGYAVLAGDAGPGARLRVVGASYPGRPFEGRLAAGACVRIFTGAAMPDGAERVVIQELVRREGADAVITAAPGAYSYVRAQGSDFAAGEILLAAGLELTPQRLVAAAAADAAELEVFRRPRVAILATGDELAAPGEAHARPGAVPDTASAGVAALAAAWGGEAAGIEVLADDLDRLIRAGAEALQRADVLVVIGGASVGERDFAKAAFEGAQPVFSKALIKPGKPVWLSRTAERLVLGLPGNPTSALVTARLFLAPLLAGLSGAEPRSALAWRTTQLAGPLAETDERETFHRARMTAGGAEPLPDQSSGAQKALAQADLLIRRAPLAPAAEAGEAVTVLDL